MPGHRRRPAVSAYDDPSVRDLAATYGDPDQLLHDDWIPEIPGITVPGSYADYAADPARFIYGPGVTIRRGSRSESGASQNVDNHLGIGYITATSYAAAAPPTG